MHATESEGEVRSRVGILDSLSYYAMPMTKLATVQRSRRVLAW